ncbi:MAG: monovalent cation/hydrogen antiporter [Bradyrhizobium sp.]|nr:monovalent cation/hydrogen antiporter [Bradyrhizobium sp.]
MLAGAALLARRINVAPAILLLPTGIALAFVPGMPSLELPPELVLLVATRAELTRELISAERKFTHGLLRDSRITDEIRRRAERDLEEASLANRDFRKEPR